jgi:hypothetical protein
MTGPDLLKDQPVQQLGTRLIHDPGEPGRDPVFFFKCGFSPVPLFFNIFLTGY